MRAKTTILLLLLPLSVAAAEVSRNVPEKFLGHWCTESPPEEKEIGESDIQISAHEIGYYRDSGKILAAAAIGDQLTLIVQLQEDGRTWLSTHEFEISGDGKQITSLQDDGQLRVRTRCPLESQQPPNNSFKPSPLRGLGAGAKIVPTPRPLSGPA